MTTPAPEPVFDSDFTVEGWSDPRVEWEQGKP